MAMMAITTSSSMRVKARRRRQRCMQDLFRWYHNPETFPSPLMKAA
jgi:hypothetical protein